MNEPQFCHSCMAPLCVEEFKGVSKIYCKHCTDENGNLLPYERVLEGTAGFLLSWQPGIDPAQAKVRAAHFLKATPAWAER